METSVRFSGFGGQGVVLMGVVLGRAAAIEGKRALQTQSYGAEARGGACHSTVIISDGRISEIEPEALDVLVAMSQPAHDLFAPLLRPEGKLLYDSDLVRPSGRGHGAPATSLARRALGRELFANSVMLGFFVNETGLVVADSVRRALRITVPKGTERENLKALEVGLGSDL